MAKKKGGSEECPQFPLWMTTFSDLMSLLLTFFILLYSMSVLDIQAFSKWISFFQGGRITTPPGSIILPPIPQKVSKLAIKSQRVLSKIHSYSAFSVIISKNEVTIRFPYGVNFDWGDYKLKPKFKKALTSLVPVLKEIKGNYKVTVQGFTAPKEKPKYSWLKDTWELSAKRATEVVRYLIANGFPRNKLVAEAYDSLKPIYKDHNKELLKKNARVELKIRFYMEDYIKGNPPTKPIKKIVPIPELENLLNSTNATRGG
jgi:chemotaxis protein MotB